MGEFDWNAQPCVTNLTNAFHLPIRNAFSWDTFQLFVQTLTTSRKTVYQPVRPDKAIFQRSWEFFYKCNPIM